MHVEVNGTRLWYDVDGRSAHADPDSWTFEACADDIPAFCAAIGVERPIVLGHSMGPDLPVS